MIGFHLLHILPMANVVAALTAQFHVLPTILMVFKMTAMQKEHQAHNHIIDNHCIYLIVIKGSQLERNNTIIMTVFAILHLRNPFAILHRRNPT